MCSLTRFSSPCFLSSVIRLLHARASSRALMIAVLFLLFSFIVCIFFFFFFLHYISALLTIQVQVQFATE
eukprot:m.86183 g.86183  ORF g.86183 m.86183 type:complete len:70 (-) comp12799_c0_seq3:3220-3429(-)